MQESRWNYKLWWCRTRRESWFSVWVMQNSRRSLPGETVDFACWPKRTIREGGKTCRRPVRFQTRCTKLKAKPVPIGDWVLGWMPTPSLHLKIWTKASGFYPSVAYHGHPPCSDCQRQLRSERTAFPNSYWVLATVYRITFYRHRQKAVEGLAREESDQKVG